MAPHSSSLAWKIPGVAESRTRLSDFTFTFHFYALEKEMATHSSVLAWRIPGMGDDYGFSVSALWCPFATPTLLLGFLLPWTWGISSRLLQQSAAAAPNLGRGVSPHGHPSWPWASSSSSQSSCTTHPPLLRRVAAPLSHRPDLRSGVAPPSQ